MEELEKRYDGKDKVFGYALGHMSRAVREILNKHLSGVLEALEEAEKVLEMFVYYEDHRISLYPLKSVVDTAISKIKGE